jgi:hypothetical protein
MRQMASLDLRGKGTFDDPADDVSDQNVGLLNSRRRTGWNTQAKVNEIVHFSSGSSGQADSE